jgi:signal transduction histidine kinase/ActR/RegA family two-component response regulator
MDPSCDALKAASVGSSSESEEGGGPEGFLEITGKNEREDEAKWVARLVGAGSVLTLVYEIAFLALDRNFLSIASPRVLALHSLNIALFLLAVIMSVRVGPWMRCHWKSVALLFGSAMIVSSTGIALETGESEPLAFMLTLFLAGTGPFLCWGEMLQGLLTLVAVASYAAVSRNLPLQVDWYQWLAVLIAAAIGLFSTALVRRQRRAQRRTEEELIKSRERLVEHERMRIAGQLAAGIAHDLNNTLNVIQLRFGLIGRDRELLAAHSKNFQAINRAIENAAQTVARVRELGIPRVADISEAVRLSDIVDQAIDLANTSIQGRSLFSAGQIRIFSCVAKDLPDVRGSSFELQQLFINLLLNASEAMPQGGIIRIESELEEDALVVRVRDQGSGIPVNYLQRIFEPFFTTKGQHGTGLGLALARKVMESIGGHISAANDPTGPGAVFTLRFSIAKPLNPAVAVQEGPKSTAHFRFLIVDDDIENLDALREMLLAAGHSVDAAISGINALERLQLGSKYDAILCDLDMPGVSGWDVARRSSELPSAPEFFIVTGWARQAKFTVPSNVGISAIISKPIGFADIDRIVEAVSLKHSHTYVSKSA